MIADGGVLGVQVLNEFTNVTRRKLTWDWKQVEAAGCRLVFSEDLRHGRKFGAVTIENPFLG